MATPLRFVLPVGFTLLTSACGGKALSTGDPSSESAGEPRGGSSVADAPAMTSPEFCAGNPSTDEMTRRIFDRLTPSPASDYLALRRVEVSTPTRRDEDPGLVTLKERGSRCAGASDRAACAKTYGRLEIEADEWLFVPLVFFTRGDEVGVARSPGQALRLLGTIDSPEEAFFLAGQTGYRFSCGGQNPAAYRATGDGFEIVAEEGGCGKPVERVVVRVRSNGETEEIGRTTTQAETSTCPQP